MEDYNFLVVTPRIYEGALTEVGNRADPDPIAKAVVVGLTTLGNWMHEHEEACILCDSTDAYRFDLGEVPPAFLCGAPAEGSDAPPIAAPICATCAKLSEPDKLARMRTSLSRLPGSRERKPN